MQEGPSLALLVITTIRIHTKEGIVSSTRPSALHMIPQLAPVAISFKRVLLNLIVLFYFDECFTWMYLYALCHAWCPGRSEEGTGSPGAGVIYRQL